MDCWFSNLPTACYQGLQTELHSIAIKLNENLCLHEVDVYIHLHKLETLYELTSVKRNESSWYVQEKPF